MIFIWKKALRDLRANLFLNLITVVTIALAVLIVSAFVLFFTNADAVFRFWISDLRIMVYLKGDVTTTGISDIKQQIMNIPDVDEAVFVSRADALARFKRQLGKQASLLEGLAENPLPDAFEVMLAGEGQVWRKVEPAARAVQALPGVDEVEYGQQWLGRFIHILHLFRVTGYALGGLFFLASVFFVANTIRLVLYSRREEVEIMRLVGASEGFIKDPFYIQSLLVGILGGGLGLGVLYGIFRLIVTGMEAELLPAGFQPVFLSTGLLTGFFLGSILVGWIGCFISLRHFSKY